MDMNQILKQAQAFQQKMAQLQEDLSRRKITSTVGGGMVSVTVNGRNELLSLKIENEVIDPKDPGMLQDLIIAAVNDAMKKARDEAQSEMGKLTGGLNIPGMI